MSESKPSVNFSDINSEKFSCFSKLVTVHVMRFKNNLMAKLHWKCKNSVTGMLSSAEIRQAMSRWIKNCDKFSM